MNIFGRLSVISTSIFQLEKDSEIRIKKRCLSLSKAMQRTTALRICAVDVRYMQGLQIPKKMRQQAAAGSEFETQVYPAPS